jgi:hypothetical protein
VAGYIGDSVRAHTPEELETLFEDALLVRDGATLDTLFEVDAIFVAGSSPAIRGREAIARRTLALWGVGQTYIADPQHILQTRTLALVVAERSIAVMRCGSDDAWRYAIALFTLDATTAKEESNVGSGSHADLAPGSRVE